MLKCHGWCVGDGNEGCYKRDKTWVKLRIFS
jgi:hypothetical protein